MRGRADPGHLRQERAQRDRGLAALTPTTFRDVPWSGPFYRRLSFEEVVPHELSPDLAGVLAQEVARGLAGDRRYAMRLNLGEQ